MAFLPPQADLNSASKPVLMRGPQAAASPNLGAPARPAVWQVVHWPLKTSSPDLSARLASRISTVPTFWMRSATDFSMSTAPAAGLFALVT